MPTLAHIIQPPVNVQRWQHRDLRRHALLPGIPSIRLSLCFFVLLLQSLRVRRADELRAEHPRLQFIKLRR